MERDSVGEDVGDLGDFEGKDDGNTVGGGDVPITGIDVGDKDGDVLGVSDGNVDGIVDVEVLPTSVGIAAEDSIPLCLEDLLFEPRNALLALALASPFGDSLLSIDLELLLLCQDVKTTSSELGFVLDPCIAFAVSSVPCRELLMLPLLRSLKECLGECPECLNPFALAWHFHPLRTSF